MKISIIGAGNVGGTAALRIIEQGGSDIVLFDVVPGLAQGKSLDLADSQSLVGRDFSLKGTDKIADIEGSSIVVITAGLARKPGMKREDLLKTNAEIIKGVSLGIKQYCPDAVVVVVTNPVDVMTLCALKNTGFKPNRVFGMGISLDTSRFANLIAQELKVAVSQVKACVIGSHGEGMVPLVRLSQV
ncbi:MAG: malate dehydrogenase, partial [Candidatus Omnitrophica bacterium]|nr:malate dehydrogenase [Candidatus Omnitrophota bacterium]